MELLARWGGVLGRLGLPRDEGTGTQLLAAYGGVDRFYHNEAHLSACLGWLDAVRDQADNADEIELALWFHDAVYDARRSDNEEMSAAWAQCFLGAAQATEALTQRVAALVLVTDHRRAPVRADEIWIVDLDLTILGSAPPIYAVYEAAIRREYAWVDAAVYAVKRGDVLRSFLVRERIYRTDYFHTRLDAQARENLRWAEMEIGRLWD